MHRCNLVNASRVHALAGMSFRSSFACFMVGFPTLISYQRRFVHRFTLRSMHFGISKGSERIVGEDEMMDLLWPHTFVGENNLSRTISSLRRVLEESPKATRWIATIPKQGYRFVGRLRRVSASTTRGPWTSWNGPRSWIPSCGPCTRFAATHWRLWERRQPPWTRSNKPARSAPAILFESPSSPGGNACAANLDSLACWIASHLTRGQSLLLLDASRRPLSVLDSEPSAVLPGTARL